MHTHPNARLTPLGRERLLRRHIHDRCPLTVLAAEDGISLRTAYKWLARYRSDGAAALVDRRSGRCTQRRTLNPQQPQHAVALRHVRYTLRRAARVLSAPLSTVGRVIKALGLGRLRNLQPAEPVRRHQWAKPGDMIHVDTKQQACFRPIVHRITGDRRLGSIHGWGYEKAHVVIYNAICLACVGVLPDEKPATTFGFLLRAVVEFDTQGITCKRVLSDNESACRSKPWREAYIALSLTPKRTRPYTPRTNEKAEQFIKTLLAEWANSMPFQTSGEQNRWLPRYLAIYNGGRCHMTLVGRTPIKQLGWLPATK